MKAQQDQIGQHKATIDQLFQAQLADPALYAATTSVARGLPLRHAQLSAQIEALEERWLAIGEELEAATAAP
jgi:hypothetical protein